MRTNFWIGVAQVGLLLFAAAIVLLAAQKLTSPANYYRLAALAAVATIGGPVPTYPAPQAQPPPLAYTAPAQQAPASSAVASYTAHSGSTVTYNLTVSNNKANSDSYHLTLRSSAGWAAADSLPSTLTLGPNSSAQFSISVRVPANADGASDTTSVTVSSDVNGEQESSTLTTVVCDGCNP